MATDSGLGLFMDVGTGTSVTAKLGRMTGGGFNPCDQVDTREGIGADALNVGGALEPGGTCSYEASIITWPNYAIRSSFTDPSLTDLCFIGNFSGDARKQTGAKISKLTIKGAVNSALTVDMEWKCLTDVADTSTPQDALTTTVFEWFTGTALIDGEARCCQDFTIELDNNIEYVYCLDTTTENTRRFPDALHVGSQTFSVNTTTLTRPTTTEFAAVRADTLGVADTCVFTFIGGTSGTQTLTITCSNLTPTGIAVPFSVGGDIISYNRNFTGAKDTACLSMAVA